MRSFPDATEEEKQELIAALFSTAIEWAKANGFSGLSSGSQWNVYNALEDAILKHSLTPPVCDHVFELEGKPHSRYVGQKFCSKCYQHKSS